MEITKENLGRYFYREYKKNRYLGVSNNIYASTARTSLQVVSNNQWRTEIQKQRLEQYKKVVSELVDGGYIEPNKKFDYGNSKVPGACFFLKPKLKEFVPKKSETLKSEIFVGSSKEIQLGINVIFWILLIGVIVYFGAQNIL